ncbi:hypothetical protein A8M32_09825 [Sinorhizobium alkalisoli]|uniref:Uncharacterized protein n=1 Tax=Sinorhizobium alkalisoli TaxID=1752398 RepID=A0A1E3VBZ6_9HYPH|nr:hypothetical protein A8M32_09825 [Sinorhizobium alkalisoli]QFI66835.1 Putative transmembrane protein [Sinorhizobium alkalisoli]
MPRALKNAIPLLVAALLSGACTVSYAGGYSGYHPYGLEPIPGSITYGGQPRTKLKKAPVGSIVPHQFNDRFGRRVYETYVIEPDRSLRLVDRRYRDFFPFDD